MSEPAPATEPEPTPFEKFTAFARQIINVPKAEADEKEREWREEREKKRTKRP